MTFVTNELLKQVYPEYVKDIERLERTTACGCSLCTYKSLKIKYPNIKLPKKYEMAVYG